jgi:hypothetical protein
MGWSWRKSVYVAPGIRLNFSGSGIGVTLGMRGAAISLGPRGTFVHVGAGGFRYAKRVGGSSRYSPKPRPAAPEPGRRAPIEHGRVESIDFAASNADELLAEIRACKNRTSLCTTALLAGLVVGIPSLLMVASAERGKWPTALPVLILACGIMALTPWLNWWDGIRSKARVAYAFDGHGSQVVAAISRFVQAFDYSDRVWSVATQQYTDDWKRNAGAGRLVKKREVQVGFGTPPNLATNIPVGFLALPDFSLYFLPDRILAYGYQGVNSFPYASLSAEGGTINFIEDEYVPSDSPVVGSTYRFVNRDGSPDLRFNGNRAIPVLSYGRLELISRGLTLHLLTSDPRIASESARLFIALRRSVSDLSKPSRLTAIEGPAIEQEVPTIPYPSPPLAWLARGITSLITVRWAASLPEWAQPIAWGMTAAIPAIALLAWLFSRISN